jgi:hypothetical protein
MLAAWTEASTWNSLTAGVAANGTEAQTAVVATLTPSATGVVSIDVLSSLLAWQGGLPNLGWALLPTGSDGWDFTSSEGTLTSRPLLTVRVLAPDVQRATFQDGVNGYAGTLDTQLAQSTPAVDFGAATSFSIDSDDPNGTGNDNHILIRFQDIIGAGPDQVPAGSNVLINKAFLVVQGFDAGDGAAVHRVLQPWNESSTWANSFGGNGVQATGIEAVALDDVTVAGATGRVEIDVTASLQAWVADPASNFGWVLLPRGNNGWDIRSAESTQPPELRVYYTVLCAADFDGSGFVDSDDFILYASQFALGCTGAGAPDPACTLSADFDQTGFVDSDDFIAYVQAFELGCN